MFSSGWIYGFGYCIQIFKQFWVNSCVQCKLVVQFHSFACGHPVLPTSFIYWRDCPFSIVYSWLLHHKLVDCICIGLFLGCLFCFIDLCVCFYANTILFWLLQLCNLKSGNGMPPAVFFLKIALSIWRFYANFRIVCSSSLKNAFGILVGITVNLYIALGSKDIFRIFF